MTDLEELLQQATSEILQASDLKNLDDFRIHYLGKKGKLTEVLKTLGQLQPEERRTFGQQVNQAKEKIQELIESRVSLLQQQQINEQLASETIDVTLSGRGQPIGSLHPVLKTRERIENIFKQMGFITLDGPEIEDDYHNFEALNMPKIHPARDMQDTFYISENLVLRTHMSSVQIRTMENSKPPIQMVAMGRTYRREFDLTHTPMFHQVEGLMVDEGITFADLRGMLTQFLHTFFESDLPLRFRSSYFPFTEPSAEVDMGCQNCAGKGCRICKNTGWLEVLGCGMVHPNVLKCVGIDSERYTGWAFGAGLDRLTMLRYGITDLRLLFENDIRFLRQF